MNLKLTLVALVVMSVLTSCTSQSLVTPSGRSRVAVNSPSSLAKYQNLVNQEQAAAKQKSDLERKVEKLTLELAALRTYLDTLQKNVPSKEAALPVTSNFSTSVGHEAMELGARKVTFRVSHAVGQIQFDPTAELANTLVKAASEAEKISIRGRTDSDVVDDVETRIALGRALRAREYLVSHGVAAAKIRTWYRSAGGFIANNETVDGRALNRRVEIEVRGIDTSSFIPAAPTAQIRRNP